jgi:SSS family solute:Na+ symporter
MIFGAVLSSFNSCLNSASALYTCDLHLKYVDPRADVRRVGQWVAVAYTVVPLAMVPLYAEAKSIIALLQQLNGLYSMPVLAIFLVAVLFERVDGRAARAGLLFGAVIYAVFTFAWTPLHYIHLMFITLVATVAFILLLSRWMLRGGGARVVPSG